MKKILIAFASVFATVTILAAPTAPVFATEKACAQADPSFATAPTVVDGKLTMTVIATAC